MDKRIVTIIDTQNNVAACGDERYRINPEVIEKVTGFSAFDLKNQKIPLEGVLLSPEGGDDLLFIDIKGIVSVI
ncbi:MAG: hypothetical protein AAGA46_00550 [Cyanobacteria bacterium P01_F01_bin.13]